MSKKYSSNRFIDNLINRYSSLSENREQIKKGAELLIKGFIHKRPLSNNQKAALIEAGGETGKQMGELLQQAIPVVSLSTHTSLNTAFLNDVDPSLIFAQQVIGLGKPGDLLWGLSTSGNSKNVTAATVAAKALGLNTFVMTGEKESRLSEICDVCIRANEREPYKIQEFHLPVYHTLCIILEDYFFA